MTDDDRRNWHPRRWQAEGVLPLRRVQVALREADPTGPESLTVRREHQVLGRQRAVLDDPRRLRDPRDQDQGRGVIEDLEVRITERRPIPVRLRARGQGREQVDLGSLRDPVKQSLIADHRERPFLPVRRIRRVDGGVDETADALVVNGLGREGPRRATTRNRLAEVHAAIPSVGKPAMQNRVSNCAEPRDQVRWGLQIAAASFPKHGGERGATGDGPRSLCRAATREAARWRPVCRHR